MIVVDLEEWTVLPEEVEAPHGVLHGEEAGRVGRESAQHHHPEPTEHSLEPASVNHIPKKLLVWKKKFVKKV